MRSGAASDQGRRAHQEDAAVAVDDVLRLAAATSASSPPPLPRSCFVGGSDGDDAVGDGNGDGDDAMAAAAAAAAAVVHLGNGNSGGGGNGAGPPPPEALPRARDPPAWLGTARLPAAAAFYAVSEGADEVEGWV